MRDTHKQRQRHVGPVHLTHQPRKHALVPLSVHELVKNLPHGGTLASHIAQRLVQPPREALHVEKLERHIGCPQRFFLPDELDNAPDALKLGLVLRQYERDFLGIFICFGGALDEADREFEKTGDGGDGAEGVLEIG